MSNELIENRSNSVKPLYLREADAHPQAAGVLPRQ